MEEYLQGPAPPAQLLVLYPRGLSSPALWTWLLVICTFSCKGSIELGLLRPSTEKMLSVRGVGGGGQGVAPASLSILTKQGKSGELRTSF